MNLSEMYQEMGIDQDVYAYGQKITEDLKERFSEIDETAEYNQLKVLHAMQKNRVSDIHFAATLSLIHIWGRDHFGGFHAGLQTYGYRFGKDYATGDGRSPSLSGG